LSNTTDFYQETHDQSTIVFYNVSRDTTTGNMTGVRFNYVDPKIPENRPRMNQIGWEARILKAMVVLGDVIQLVNRGYKNVTPFATFAPDSEFMKLDQQLDYWGQQLPLNLRNTPANLERYRREHTQKSASFVLVKKKKKKKYIMDPSRLEHLLPFFFHPVYPALFSLYSFQHSHLTEHSCR
jgi:hypothetical protein